MDPFLWSVVKISTITALAFIGAGLLTPLVTHYLYKYKLGKSIRVAEQAPVYHQHHAHKAGTPTMGGVIIWLTVALLAGLVFVLNKIPGLEALANLDFLSRSQTWLPLGALLAAAVVGLVDDFFNVRKIGPVGGGLRLWHKLLLYAVIAAIGAWWFFFKLDWDVLSVPFYGDVNVGWWYIPIFFLVIVATSFSVNETDGLDGLAGGVLMTNFIAFGAIAYMQGKYDLAALCGAIVGALLAFLWFNVPPARFFMGDTGAMALGVTLGIIAMLTNTVVLLPIIGIILVIESLSVIIQVLSRRFRGKKVFHSAPWHHHLEAVGWPEAKIVMRLWIISGVFSLVGFIIYLISIYGS
ncbi:MAG: phospho-N-acetylmuramoyl-pentapeptide-transferase [Candidatus Komeilibacteria bacterium]|nr:phospho-N-acetylmuramoyl-pentapeptide-transferase [Candidatus Komeilibacteria bacterium]